MSFSIASINYDKLKLEVLKILPNSNIIISYKNGSILHGTLLAINGETIYVLPKDADVLTVDLNNLEQENVVNINKISDPEEVNDDDVDEYDDDQYLDMDTESKLVNINEKYDVNILDEEEPLDKTEVLDDFISIVTKPDEVKPVEKIIEKQLALWDISWSDDELLESLTGDLVENFNKKNLSDQKIYEINYKRAKNILSHFYQINDSLKISNKDVLYGDNYKPLVTEILNNNFTNNFIKPILYDQKKIYTENKELLDMDNMDEDMVSFHQSKFIDFNKEMEIIQSLYIKYNRHKNTNVSGNNILNYNQLKNILANGGNINLEKIDNDDGNHTGKTTEENVIFDSLNNGFINPDNVEQENNSLQYFQTENIPYGTHIYRYCNTKNPCFGINNDKLDSNPSNIFEMRYVNGNEYVFEDILSDKFISDRRLNKGSIRTCNGTNKTGDSFYAHTSNKKVFNKSDFNRCINTPPKRNIFIDGEKINIVGFYIDKVDHIVPNIVNQTYNSNERLLNQFNKNNNSNYNLIDYVNYENKKIDKNDISIINIDDTDSIDYTKNNFIVFQTQDQQLGKKLNKSQLESYLNDIIPDISKILTIEEDNLANCYNFQDLNKILSKYHLHTDFLNKNTRKNVQLKEFFIDKTLKYNNYVEYELNLNQKYKNDVNNLNLIINYINDVRNTYQSKKYVSHNKLNNFINNLENILSTNVFDTFNHVFSLDDIKRFISLININYQLPSQEEYNEKLYLIRILTKAILNNNIYNINEYNNSIINSFNINTNKHVHDYFKLFNIEIKNNKFSNYQNTKLNNNDLKSINFFNKIYKFGDSNRFIYNYIKLLDINRNLTYNLNKYHPETLENVVLRKRSHLENLKNNLDLNKTVFNKMKEHYSFYIQRCEGFKVVKIYHSKLDLKKDDFRTDIEHDDIFDTLRIDQEIVTHYLQYNSLTYENTDLISEPIKSQLINEFKKFYPLDTNAEILIRFNNVISGKKNKVIDGNFALLIDNGSRFLYKRVENHWIVQTKEDVLNKSQMIMNLNDIEYLVENTFEQIINDSDIEENPRNISNTEYKCVDVEYQNINSKNNQKKCIPKILLNYFNTLTKTKKEYLNLLSEIEYLSKLNTQKAELIENIENIIHHYEIIKKNSLVKNKFIDTHVPVINSKLKNKFQNIINITDVDERLSQIKIFIESHGRISQSDDDELEGFIYWNNLESDEILCCSHYLHLCDMAYKDEETKSKIIRDTIERYKGDINDEFKTCKICGEALDYVEQSTFEGFSSDDKPIIFREKVVINEDEHKLDISDNEIIFYNNLMILTNRLGLNLTNEDITFIVKNIFLESNKLFNLTEFYLSKKLYAGQSSIKGFVKMLSQEFIKKNGKNKTFPKDKYKKAIVKGGNEFFGSYEVINDQNLENITDKNSNTFYFKKYVTSNFFKNAYEKYIINNQIAIMLNYLIIILETAIPSYTIKSIGDERKAKVGQAFIGNLWEKEGIEYLFNIVDTFRSYRQPFWKHLINLKSSNTREIFIENYFTKYTQIIRDYHLVKNKIRNKEQYLSNQDKQIDIEEQSYILWPEFRPSLILNLSAVDVPINDTRQIIDNYSTNLEKYQQHIINGGNPQISNLLYSNLVESEKILKNTSLNLGEKFIIGLNKYLLDIKKEQFISNNMTYTSYCDYQNINNSYLDNVFEVNIELYNLYTNLLQLNNYIHTIDNKIEKNLLSFNEVNSSLEKMKSWEKGRQFLNYMYVTRDLFSNENKYIDYLKNKILQINLMIITNNMLVNNKESSLGQKRFFKNIYDEDYVIMNEHNLDKESIINALLDKYENKISRDFITNKVDNLLNMTDILRERKKSGDKNFYLELDIVSGLYKYQIKNIINERISNMNLSELLTEIENLESFLQSNNILSIKNGEIDNKLVFDELDRIIGIESSFQDLFGIFQENELSDFSAEFTNKKHKIDNIAEQNAVISTIRNIFSSNLDDIIHSNYTTIQEYLKSTDNILSNIDKHYTFHLNLGKNVMYHELLEKNLNNELKIQNYKSGDFDTEKEFRKRELITKKIESQRIMNLKKYIKNIVNISNSLFTKINNQSNFMENVQKNSYTFDSIGIEMKENLTNNFIEEFTELDTLLQNIFSTDIHKLDFPILNVFSEIYQKSESIYSLIDLLSTNSNSYSCEKIQKINILLPEFISKTLHFILSNLLNNIISSTNHNDLNNKIIVTLVNYINNTIITNEQITRTLDTEIEQAIKEYIHLGNVRRKKRFNALSDELQGVQKLFRRWNLGDIFSGYEDDNQDFGLEELTDENIDNMIEEEELMLGSGDNDGNNDIDE